MTSTSSQPPGASEGRAIDDLERAASPRFLAELFARVGEPSAPARPVDPERAEAERRQARATAAADPAFVARLGRHERAADELAARVPPAPPLALERGGGPVALAPLARAAGEAIETEPPADLAGALAECTPQAMLRDLHRPVTHFGDILLRPVELGFDRSGALAREAVRRALRHGHRAALAELATGSRIMREERAMLAETLARPWAESRPATPTPAGRPGPGADDMRWFGLEGGYDPDV